MENTTIKNSLKDEFIFNKADISIKDAIRPPEGTIERIIAEAYQGSVVVNNIDSRNTNDR